jgi:hypothetical protein
LRSSVVASVGDEIAKFPDFSVIFRSGPIFERWGVLTSGDTSAFVMGGCLLAVVAQFWVGPLLLSYFLIANGDDNSANFPNFQILVLGFFAFLSFLGCFCETVNDSSGISEVRGCFPAIFVWFCVGPLGIVLFSSCE